MTGFYPFVTRTDGSVAISPADGMSQDAFGRLRVSEPYSLFAAKQTQSAEPLLHNQSLTGGGTATYDSAKAGTVLAVTTANGDVAIKQSKVYVPYEPGRSQLIFASGVMGTGQANTVKRIGYFDVDNGAFFEQSGTTLRVVTRKATVDTAVAQSAWNIDKLDGTGRSGLTLDLTKIQLFVIDLTWLGAGRIRFGFFLGAELIYCHEYSVSNTITGVSFPKAALPVRYEIRNTGVAANPMSMDMICYAVLSEGGFKPPGKPFSCNNANTAKSIGTTLSPVISIRLKAASPRVKFDLAELSLIVDSSTNFRWELLLNTTLTGAAFASVDTNSYMDFDTAATALTGGTRLCSGYSASTFRVTDSTFQDWISGLVGSDFLGTTNDILTLAACNTTGAAAGYFGSMCWRELN